MMKYVGNGVDSFKIEDTTYVLAKGKKGKLFHNKIFVFDEDGKIASSMSNESIRSMIIDQRKN